MEFLNKISKKKIIVILSTVLTAIISTIALYVKFGINTNTMSNMSDLSSIQSQISLLSSIMTILNILFYVLLIAFVVMAVLSGFFFFKKQKDPLMLVEMMIGILIASLFASSIPGMSNLSKLVKLVSGYLSGSTSILSSGFNYTELASMSSSLEGLSNYLKFIAYTGIAALIFNIVVILIYNKVIKVNHPLMTWDEGSTLFGNNQPRFDPQTGQPIQPQSISFDGVGTKFKAFIKTKNGLISIGVAAAVIGALIGYNVYNTYFNKTKINLTEKMSVVFSGDDGEGRVGVKSNDIDYDKTDSDIQSFVKSISYDYQNNGKLSNGDKIKVSVVYSKATAESLKLDVTSDTKEFTVSGLTERYKNASKVPGEVFKLAKTYLDEKAKSKYKNSSYTSYTYSLDSVYFGKTSSHYQKDIIVGVYKVTSSYTGFGGNETKTYYEALYFTGIDSNFTTKYAKQSPYAYQQILYNPQSFDRLSDPSKIKSTLDDEFDDYSITQFE